MHKNRTILKSIQRQDFNIQTKRIFTDEPVSDPMVIFAPALEFFRLLAVGKYFWFIADPNKGLTFAAGGQVHELTPLTADTLSGSPPDKLFEHTHPEDLLKMFAFSKYWVDLVEKLPEDRKPYVRPTIFIRMKNNTGNYNWVMVQYAQTIANRAGNILYVLTLVTDVSHIKKDGVAMMSILDTHDNKSHVFYCSDTMAVSGDINLTLSITNREQEILGFLALGYSSKQIAGQLNIALKTVDNHRQNLLRKTNCKSTGELVAQGINMGFI